MSALLAKFRVRSEDRTMLSSTNVFFPELVSKCIVVLSGFDFLKISVDVRRRWRKGLGHCTSGFKISIMSFRN